MQVHAQTSNQVSEVSRLGIVSGKKRLKQTGMVI
jgi:hypothetical protein